jgi:hypothetical protein
VRTGIVSCAVAFFLLSRVQGTAGLYAAGSLLAVTSATVVTGLNSLGSFEAREGPRRERRGAGSAQKLGSARAGNGSISLLQSVLVGWEGDGVSGWWNLYAWGGGTGLWRSKGTTGITNWQKVNFCLKLH